MSQTLPAYSIRPYQGSDEAALIALWNATMTHDRIAPSTFRSKVLLDLNFRPEGLLLAEAQGRLVGFVLSITRQVPLFLQGLEPEQGWITAFGVHPEWRRQGIGQRLFGAAQDWLMLQGRRVVSISPYTPNYFIPGVDVEAYQPAMHFLLALGWQIHSQPISMQAETTGFQVPPAIIAREQALSEIGIGIRPVQPADLPELMPFIARHFGWDWVRFAQEYLLELFGPGSDQICFLVAVRKTPGGEQIAGYCQQRRERFGPFGVDPELRGQGIGRVLLFRCLEAMVSRGFHAAWFLWTGEDAARLYAQAGFQKVRQFAIFQRSLV